MRFTKWLMKKGSMGSAARLIIRAYIMQKEADPDKPDMEIFKTITKYRYSIAGNNIDAAIVGTAAQPVTFREYLKYLLIYEGLPDSIDLADTIGEIVDEICDKQDIS